MTDIARIAEILHDAAETHHVVWRITDGDDPDWASWYADWLLDLSDLPKLLGAKPVRSHLVHALVQLDREHTGSGEPWESVFAQGRRALRLTPTSADEDGGRSTMYSPRTRHFRREAHVKPSRAIADALTTFFVKNASGDTSTFHEVVSRDDAVLAIGSSVREWFSGQEAARSAYGLEGFEIEPGPIDAWENGDTGWAACRPLFRAPGDVTLRLRFTAVFVRESGGWKLIHLHGSYPVPDELAMGHPEWWDGE